jgi:hypothetical protein
MIEMIGDIHVNTHKKQENIFQRIHIFHFVVDCPLYENIRVKFFDKVIDICPNFRYMDTSSKFFWLFTNEHEQVLKKLGS